MPRTRIASARHWRDFLHSGESLLDPLDGRGLKHLLGSAAAHELVAALNSSGARAITIYDDAGRLRLEAVGSQPPRLLP